MSKKIIFLDIDGTLTEPGQNVPPQSALDAIAAARKAGHLVYLCSGRNEGMLRPLLQYPWDGYIASNGGYIVSGGEVIFDCPMTPRQQKLVMDTLADSGVFRTAECRDGSYTDEGFKDFLREHADEKGNSELLRWRVQVESSLGIRPMSEYPGTPIYKVVFMSPSADRLQEPERKLSDQFQLVIQDPGENGIINGEIINRRFDKGKAVEKVAEREGVPIEDTIGFGDSMNDAEMIQAVGLGICMENGSPQLKALAKDICPSVTDDGLAKAFEKYGLT